MTGDGVIETRRGAVKLLVGRVGGVAGSLVLGQFFLGLSYVVAARRIGPASLGLIATCFAIGAVAATVFDLGMTGYQVREIASGKLTLLRARALTAAKRCAAPVLVVPSILASVLIMPVLGDGILLGLTGWAIWEAQTANSLLRALEMFTRAASAQLLGRLGGFILTVTLPLIGRPEQALAVGLLSSFLIEAALDNYSLRSASHFRESIGTRRASMADMLGMQRRTVSFGLVSLAGVGQQLDSPAVTAGGGAAVGGLYAAAGRLLGPLLFLSTSLALVGAPWLARAQREPNRLMAEERRIRQFALALCLAPLAAAVLGPVVIPAVLGRAFAESGAAFSVLAVGAAFSTVNQGSAIIVQNRGHQRSVATSIGIGLMFGLITSYLLARIGGPAWAAVGFTVSQLYILAHLSVTMRRTRPTVDGQGSRG
jgi:O-antigen/teichoic acid export membrane protein